MLTVNGPAGIGARQSKGNDLSIEDQVRAGERACEAEGWPVFRIYRDRVSASRFEGKPRDEWPELLADVEAGQLGVVVLWDVSRGDRKPAEWATFLEICRRTGTRVHLVRGRRTYDVSAPDDWKMLHDLGTAAGYDSEVRSADSRRGVAEAAAAGKPHGPAGFGFTRRYDPVDRKKFEDVPNEEAAVAREIIERVARRDPIGAIMRDLNERQAGGRSWSRKAIKLVATNPRYIGLRRHSPRAGGDAGLQGTLHKAAWPAIVDEGAFWRAVAVLGESDRKRSAPGGMKHLLSYIVVCGVRRDGKPCGADFSANPSLKARPRYHCANGCTSVGMEAADEYVLRLVLGLLSRPEARQMFAHATRELDAAGAEVARLERLLEEARDAFDHDVISAVALGRKEKKLIPLIEQERQRVRAAQQADAVLELLGDGEFTEVIGRRRWAAQSVAARRAVIKALFDQIECGLADSRLHAHSSWDDRVAHAARRITVKWTNHE